MQDQLSWPKELHINAKPRIGGMSDCYPEQVLPLMVRNLRAFSEGRLKDMRNVV